MADDEIKQKIMEFMEKSSGKGKKKSYAKDVVKGVGGDYKSREVKKEIQALLDEGKLAYWSSGSTTYVMLKADYEELAAKEEAH